MRVAGSDDFPFQRDDFHFDTVDGRNPAITTWDGAKTRCKQWDKRPSPQTGEPDFRTHQRYDVSGLLPSHIRNW